MEYKCNKCNKIYSSYQSLWIHNKKYHVNIVTITPPESVLYPPKNDNISPKIYCEYCKNIFTRKDSLKKHYSRCKNKESNEVKLQEENKILKEQLKQNNKDMEIFKKQILDLINKNCKVH